MYQCPMCNSQNINLLGILGSTVHLRCRQCGYDFSDKANERGEEDFGNDQPEN